MGSGAKNCEVDGKGGVGCRSLPASRSDPSGLGRAEAFGNSLEDSVSSRFPSQSSLGGSPAPSARSLSATYAAFPSTGVEWKDKENGKCGDPSLRVIRDAGLATQPIH